MVNCIFVHGLLEDCESMGGSNEFFDKFSVRYHISVIFKQLWEDPRHRQVIVRESRLVMAVATERIIGKGEFCKNWLFCQRRGRRGYFEARG